MEKRTFGMAAATLVLVAGSLGAQQTQDKFVVGVCNFAHVPDRILKPALERAEATFRKAGLETQWVVCADRAEATDLNVRILADLYRTPDSLDALGKAYVAKGIPSNLADVYYGLLEERAPTNYAISCLMSAVMVHEVGHLLGIGHAADGIMQSNFSKAEVRQIVAGGLQFAASDVAHLRAAVAARFGGR
jgi:hypothetical protein